MDWIYLPIDKCPSFWPGRVVEGPHFVNNESVRVVGFKEIRL